MRIFSTSYTSRIEKVVSALGITSDALVFGPDTVKKDAETVLRIVGKNTLVFIPDEMKSVTEGLPIITVHYGSRLNSHEGDTYTDNYEASIHFTYHDPDTVEVAYALATCFGKPLSLLEGIVFDSSETVTVRSEEEAMRAARRLVSHEKTCLVYRAKGFSDVKGLASQFSHYDYVVLPEEAENMKKMDRALDRVVFSPVQKRLSAVFHSSDGLFCAKMNEIDMRVVEIILVGDEL